jgi:hypothetical protein
LKGEICNISTFQKFLLGNFGYVGEQNMDIENFRESYQGLEQHTHTHTYTHTHTPNINVKWVVYNQLQGIGEYY